MSNIPPLKPWRFVALCDIPELGALTGDVVSHQPGREIRLTRRLPANSGLLLNLLLDDKLGQFDEMIGPDSAILDAFDKVDASLNAPPRPQIRVLR